METNNNNDNNNNNNLTHLQSLGGLSLSPNFGTLTAVLISVIVFGFSSNVVVMVVLLKGFSTSTLRTFQLTMTVSDLVVTGVAAPLRIWSLERAYTFFSATACKMVFLITSLSTNTSVFITGCMALHSLWRVTVPYFPRIALVRAYYYVIVAVGLAVLVTLPFVPLFGVHTTPLSQANATRLHFCWVDDAFKDGHYLSLYKVVLGVNYVASFGLIFVPYAMIMRKISDLQKVMEARLRREVEKAGSRSCISSPGSEKDGRESSERVPADPPEVEMAAPPVVKVNEKVEPLGVTDSFSNASAQRFDPSPTWSLLEDTSLLHVHHLLGGRGSTSMYSQTDSQGLILSRDSLQSMALGSQRSQPSPLPARLKTNGEKLTTPKRQSIIDVIFPKEFSSIAQAPSGEESAVDPHVSVFSFSVIASKPPAKPDRAPPAVEKEKEKEEEEEEEPVVAANRSSMTGLSSLSAKFHALTLFKPRGGSRIYKESEMFDALDHLQGVWLRTAESMIAVGILFIVTWFPNLLIRLIRAGPADLCEPLDRCEANRASFYVSSVFLASVFNPVVYCFTNFYFRLVFTHCLHAFCPLLYRNRRPSLKEEEIGVFREEDSNERMT